MTWQLVGQDEEVIGETSLLPPDARPVVIVTVNAVASDDGAGDVFVKYRLADSGGRESPHYQPHPRDAGGSCLCLDGCCK